MWDPFLASARVIVFAVLGTCISHVWLASTKFGFHPREPKKLRHWAWSTTTSVLQSSFFFEKSVASSFTFFTAIRFSWRWLVPFCLLQPFLSFVYYGICIPRGCGKLQREFSSKVIEYCRHNNFSPLLHGVRKVGQLLVFFMASIIQFAFR